MDRLQEIKNKYGGTFLLHVKKDSPGMDIVWLIDKLEKAIDVIDSVATSGFGDAHTDNVELCREFLKELE